MTNPAPIINIKTYETGFSEPNTCRKNEINNIESAAEKEPIIMNTPVYAPLTGALEVCLALSTNLLTIAKGNPTIPTISHKIKQIINNPTYNTIS